jgi:PAS domain S-box-containing protein
VGAAIALVYLLAGLLEPWGHADPVRTVAPAAGVALATLLIFGPRYGVAIWIAATAVGLVGGLPVLPALLTGAASALGAVVGCVLLRGPAGFRFRIDRMRDVAAFAVLGVFTGPAVSAFVGGPALSWTDALAGQSMGTAIAAWWMSDAIGILVVTPLVLAFVVDRRPTAWPRTWPIEASLGLAATALLAVGLFGGRVPEHLVEATLLLPLPFLLWGVFRFGLHGAASVMAVYTAVVVWRTGSGFGPFAGTVDAMGNAPLWIYLLSLGVVALVTWALVAEHQSSLERFQAVFQHSSEGLILLHRGRVTQCNSAAVELFGTRAADRLQGVEVSRLSPHEQPDGALSVDAIHARMREADREGKRRFAWTLERADGTTFPADISLSPVVVGGQPGHLAVIRDATDRVARQAALEKARVEAEAADRAKTAYLGEVSHKIRTDLNTNLGFARMIAKNRDLPDKERQYVEKVLASGASLMELVDDVLETSRIESERMGFSTASAFDPARLLEEVVETFRARAKDKKISLDQEVVDNVPAKVVAQRRKLAQALNAIVGHAVKETSEGGILVKMSRTYTGDEPERVGVGVEVVDTGPGITPEELDELMKEAEVEAGEPGAYRIGGLAQARAAAREMGGDLVVENRPGGGTRFRLEIRAGGTAPGGGAVEEGTRKVIGLEGEEKPRILIVDDTEENRTLLQGLLTRVGFETRTAKDGIEALEAFGNWKPALVLMDRQMPAMDGSEATRRIKASEEGKATPVVMVTAGGFGANREEIAAAGADGYVRVPIHEAELFRELKRHLGVRYVYEG